jgi:hypothetical protein
MNRQVLGLPLGLLLVLSILISACATPRATGVRNTYVETKPWSYFGTAPEPFWWSGTVEMAKLHKNAKKYGNGRTVAILDSGFSANHPDVTPPTRIHSAGVETCSVSPNKNTDDINGHGTAMAVIALGDEKPDTPKGLATGGIAAKANLLPIKVVCGVSTADSVTRGVDAAVAVNPPVDVILLALGGWPSDRTTDAKNETLDAHLSDVLKKHRNILFVVASVWDGTSYLFPNWTAEENVIVVAAMTQTAATIPGPPTEEYYSGKRGDIWAPGRDVQTAFIDVQDPKISGKYGDYLMQGTSAAAAIVAGCAAAVKLDTDTVAKTLRDRLINKAQTTNALPGGEPRLNCLAAVTP